MKPKKKVDIKGSDHKNKGIMLVIDGMSDFHRHYWKMAKILGPTVAGFFGMIRGVFSYRKMAEDVRIVWEGNSTLRKNLNVLYKVDRKRMEGNFYEQLNDTQEFLSHFFKQYMVKEYESDDMCSTIAVKRSMKEKQTIIATGDGDLHQIINEYINIYHPAKKEMFTKNDVQFKEVDNPLKLLGLWALEGDSSDNISGIKRLKHRDQIAKQYYPSYDQLLLGDLEFEHYAQIFIDRILEDKNKIISINDMAKVKGNEDLIYNNMDLIRLREVPKENYTKIEKKGDPKALIKKYGCEKSLSKYLEE